MIKAEAKLKQILPNLFALRFAVWGFVSMHYFPVLALWLYSQKINGYTYALLSFTTFSDDSNLSAASPKGTLKGVFQFHENDFSNAACIIGDKYSTNCCLTRTTDFHFVGCASPPLRLGIKSIVEKYNIVLCKIRCLMVHLGGLRRLTKLCHVSGFSPVLSNFSRWSSVKEMVHHCIKLHPVLAYIVPA